MRRLFFVILFVLALVMFLSITTSVGAHGHGHVYYPSHRGAPMWSYYTGDYGHSVYVPPPRYYPPTYHVSPRYYSPPPAVYRYGGGVDIGRIHVRW